MVEHDVGKASEFEDGQIKEVIVGNGNNKVLLAKTGGQFYATSTKCTHYGAPLYKGAFSYDGRVVCPWHGACFNVKTGDIEDSPGLDNLQTFKVTVKDDRIYVEADEEALKVGRRQPKCKVGPSPFDDDNTVVILGGGASGNAAAEKLREDGFSGKIILVSRESYLPIDRPKLSKNFGFDIEKLTLRKKEFYDGLMIELKLGVTATEVDPKSKTVTLSDGKKLKYNSLIIATGADPRRIPIPGIELKNVFYLRTYDDYKNIEKAIAGDKKDFVIIGSSFIGMEVAAMSSKKANVSVIGMEKVPFERVLGEKIGGVFQKLHEGAGVKFHLQAGVKSIEPSETDSSICGKVVLNSGTELKADVVLVGAGVIPSTEFLKNTAGFTLEKDNSLKVTENFKVEGLEDVYAIGDIARFHYPVTNETLRIEHWSFAENTGRAVAEFLTTKRKVQFKKIPYFWSNQLNKGLRYCGYASSFDDVIVQGSLEKMEFAAFYARGEKIVAVATISKDPVASYSSELLRLDKFPTATEIRNGKNPLDVPLLV